MKTYMLICLMAILPVSVWAETPIALKGAGDDAPVVLGESRISAEFTTEKKTATLELSRTIDSGPDQGVTSYSLKIAGPFDDDGEDKLLGDLDGLKNAATAAFTWRWASDSINPPKGDTYRVCQELAREWGIQWGEFAECSYDAFPDQSQARRAEFQQRFTEALQGIFKTSYVVAVTAKAGSKKFDFVQGTTDDPIAAGKSNKTVRSIGIAGGRLSKRNAVWSAGLRHEISYEAGPATETCIPIDMTDALRCTNLSPAPPAKEERNVVHVQYLAFPQDGNIGVSLRVSRDIKNNVTGAEVPVYLVREAKSGQLRGGVKLSWQSEDDELVFGVFATQPLGFLSNL